MIASKHSLFSGDISFIVLAAAEDKKGIGGFSGAVQERGEEGLWSMQLTR